MISLSGETIFLILLTIVFCVTAYEYLKAFNELSEQTEMIRNELDEAKKSLADLATAHNNLVNLHNNFVRDAGKHTASQDETITKICMALDRMNVPAPQNDKQ